MNGSFNLPVLGRVDKKSVFVGAGIMLLLMIVPKVSTHVVPVVARLQSMVFGGAK
jgi:hypothetical protein